MDGEVVQMWKDGSSATETFERQYWYQKESKPEDLLLENEFLAFAKVLYRLRR
jgi:hypothetical protein